MPTIVVGRDDYVGQWVFKQLDKLWNPQLGKALGFANDSGEIIAGVTFTQYDGINIWLDVAAVGKSRWLDRRGLWAIFQYCFDQLKVVRVTAAVNASNTKSRKLVEQAGFVQEATLQRAASGGDDVILYRMFREECRWLGKGSLNG